MTNERESLGNILETMQELPEFIGIQLQEVNQEGGFGNRPLHIAISWKRADAVAILLDAGADVNARGERGETALHRAVLWDLDHIVTLLLQRGASPEIADEQGATTLEVDVKIGSKRSEGVIRRWLSDKGGIGTA